MAFQYIRKKEEDGKQKKKGFEDFVGLSSQHDTALTISWSYSHLSGVCASLSHSGDPALSVAMETTRM